MMQRFITGSILLVIAAVTIAFGGWVLGLILVLCTCLALHEMDLALTAAGYRLVSWPNWICLFLSIGLTHFFGIRVTVPLFMCTTLIVIMQITFRHEPRLDDLLVSLLPLLGVVFPGLCLVGISSVQPKSLQMVYMGIIAAVPVMGDTMAYFVGSKIKGPKLCPPVSPNKTISGSIAGLVGSALAAMVLYAVTRIYCSPEALATYMPSWWQFLLLGLLGGVVEQMGDLFASLVKRHCGIKDYSNLFPGHGGMMDRIDSVLFMSILVFCYRLLTYGI